MFSTTKHTNKISGNGRPVQDQKGLPKSSVNSDPATYNVWKLSKFCKQNGNFTVDSVPFDNGTILLKRRFHVLDNLYKNDRHSVELFFNF